MFLAIETKYLGPTNRLGARIQASTSNGHLCTIHYPHEVSEYEAHRMAAEKLIEKYTWSRRNLVAGGLRNGYVWVTV